MIAKLTATASRLASSYKCNNGRGQFGVIMVRSLSLKIEKVGVVGLGLMGSGVAQVVAQAGYQVLSIETNEKALQVGIRRIEDSLSKLIAKDKKKGTLTEEAGKQYHDEVMSRISSTFSLADAKDCDLIIEAIAENMDLKLDFYERIGPMVKSDALFASNTSSLPITAMGQRSGRPSQFAGLHFFNPVQIMKLVEVVKTEHTSNETFEALALFGKSIGKVTVSCKDTPGFIVNRLLVPYLAQAMLMVDRGDASVHDIDVSMQLGAGHPMGPLQLADYVGLDTCHSILQGWQESYRDEPAFVVPECLKRLVNQGKFGRKSGSGFYRWDGDKAIALDE